MRQSRLFASQKRTLTKRQRGKTLTFSGTTKYSYSANDVRKILQTISFSIYYEDSGIQDNGQPISFANFMQK
jgi:hypothetical protein